MTSTLAAVFEAPGSMRLERIDTPIPVNDEILVRVSGCTICGSDLHTYLGRRSVPTPSILGHEIVGEIAQFGPQANRTDGAGRSLELGDRVSWAVVANCGRCFYCQKNVPQKCVSAIKYGHQAFTPGRELTGGLAEHCLLVSGTKLVRWNRDVPISVACPASCATATAMAALGHSRVLEGCAVVVMGGGLLGLMACAIAAVRGAERIVCVEPVESRQRLAEQFGATHAMTPDHWPAWSRENLPYGADVAIEMSGKEQAFQALWPVVRIGGSISLVGSVFPGPPVPIALEQIVRRCLHLHGVHNYAIEHLVEAVDFLTVNRRRFPFEMLVQRWFPLDQIDQAFEAAQDRSAIRIGIGNLTS